MSYNIETKTGEVTFEEALEDAKAWLKTHDTRHWVYDAKESQSEHDTFEALKASYESYKQTPAWSNKYKENETLIRKVDEAYKVLTQSPTFEAMQKHVIDLPIYHFAQTLREVANEKIYLQEVGDASAHPTAAGAPGSGRKMHSLWPKVLAKAGTAILRDRHVLSALRTVRKKVPLIIGHDVTQSQAGKAPIVAAPAAATGAPLTAPETVPPVQPPANAALPEPAAAALVTQPTLAADGTGTITKDGEHPDISAKNEKKEKQKSEFKKILKGLKALRTASKSSKSGGHGKKSHFSSFDGGEHGEEEGHSSSDSEHVEGAEEEGSGSDSDGASSASSVSFESVDGGAGDYDGGDYGGGGDDE